MSLLLGLIPFVLFFALMRFDVSYALWGAFGASLILCIRDFVRSGVLRALDAGSILLFGMLAFYTGFFHPMSIPAVRFSVDGSLTFIAFASLAMRSPFTLQYAREQVPSDFWSTPLFIRTNYMLTAVWAIAFAVTAAADAAATFDPADISLPISIVIGFTAMGIAFVFTIRYAALVRKQAGLPHGGWF